MKLALDHPLQQVPCEWPNGSFKITFAVGQAPIGWDKSSWAWENRRKDLNAGTTNYRCRGVWCCSRCSWKLRPNIRAEDLKKQYEKKCGVCNVKLEYVICRAEIFKTTSDSTFTYEHRGLHTHPKPPEGKAHPQHYQKLRDTIINNPNTSPHALIIGSSLPTNDGVRGPSQSVGDIAPQFNNTSRVSKIRKQILSDHVYEGI